VVELLGHPELVVDGERDALLLGPVSQGRVVDLDVLGQSLDVAMTVTLLMSAGNSAV
jgi:hypothetical protein